MYLAIGFASAAILALISSFIPDSPKKDKVVTIIFAILFFGGIGMTIATSLK